MHWNSIGTDVAGKWNTKVELSVLLLRGIRDGQCNKVVVIFSWVFTVFKCTCDFVDMDSIQKKPKLMAKPWKIKRSQRGEMKIRLFTFYFFTFPQGISLPRTTSFATTDGLATILH